MNIKQIEGYLRGMGSDLLMAAAGLVLMLNPAGAMAWIIKLLGWILVGFGAATLLVPVLNHRQVSTESWVWNGLCIAAGVLLLTRPLFLVDLMGKVLGVMLLVSGVRNLKDGLDARDLVSIVGGVVLLVMPRTLTNTVLILVGVVLLIISGLRIAGWVLQRKCLEEGKDPNIIDAL